MWAKVVKVIAPSHHQIARMVKAIEQMLVQALVTPATVDAFNIAVLHWFTRRDVVPIDFAVFLPLQDRIRSQFCSVVADHHAGIATYLSDPTQFTCHTFTLGIMLRITLPCSASRHTWTAICKASHC